MPATPSTIDVGDEIPPLTRQAGFANWNRYAAVNDEFVPIHMDDDAGRAAGYPTAFGMGNLQWSYLHTALRSWLGPDARIHRLQCQFRGSSTKGMVVTARGRVTEVTRGDAGVTATIEVWTQDQEGNVLAPGTAVVELP